jgi:hypothetical protein
MLTTIAERIDRFMAAHSDAVVACGRHAYLGRGRGAVILLVSEEAWLDQAPDEHPTMEYRYATPGAISKELAGQPDIDVLVRLVRKYDPHREVIAAVWCADGTVAMGTLRNDAD